MIHPVVTKRTCDVLLPELGAYYAFTPELGILGGVYRGFSPPPPDSGDTPPS
jgi:Fe(3+) dicitrate transport protein